MAGRRCSREKPKCSACKPWPSGCDYSRDEHSTGKRIVKRKAPDRRLKLQSVANETIDETDMPSSFSFLQEATQRLTAANGSPSSQNLNEARSELRDLGSSLSMTAKSGSQADGFAKSYHIPNKATGYAYISRKNEGSPSQMSMLQSDKA